MFTYLHHYMMYCGQILTIVLDFWMFENKYFITKKENISIYYTINIYSSVLI